MTVFPPMKQGSVLLRRGETLVLKADDANYDRGLIVSLAGKGGYDIAYWYDSPEKIYPAEVRIDGKTITKDGKVVHIGYHPELAQYVPAYGNPQVQTQVVKCAAVGLVAGKLLFDKPLAGAAVGAIYAFLTEKEA